MCTSSGGAIFTVTVTDQSRSEGMEVDVHQVSSAFLSWSLFHFLKKGHTVARILVSVIMGIFLHCYKQYFAVDNSTSAPYGSVALKNVYVQGSQYAKNIEKVLSVALRFLAKN